MRAAPSEVHLHRHVEQAFHIASTLHNEGRLREADGLYQFILAVMPAHFDSLLRLGTLRARAREMEHAVHLLRRAVAVNPQSADALCTLGLALATLGRRDEALARYREALVVSPQHAGTLNALGTALHAAGQTAEAIACLQRAIAAMPDHASAHFTLGNILRERGQLGAAMVHLRKVIALQPGTYAAHNNLATILQKLGHFDEAAALYKHALTINPEFADAWYNLGTVYLALNRNQEAIEHTEKALQLNPSMAIAHNNIGIALQNLGRMDDARGAYEKSLQLDPRRGATHLNLAYLRRFTPGDPQLAALQELADDASLDGESRIAVQFSLARAFSDLGDHQRSARHLRDANALKRARLDYDEKHMLALFERIQAVFTPELMRQKSGAGDPSETPVFIVGMPRSGTTLLEQILASHSKVYGAGEIEAFYQALVKVGYPNGGADAFPDMVPSLSPEMLRKLGSTYLAMIRAAAPAAERIVNKLPLNFKYVGLIHLALPNARIVHIRRDPLDTCFSCFSLLFSGDQSFTYDQRELARYYRAYAELMAHWRSVLPEGVMVEVQYEDLIADLAGEAGAVLAHCGLAWEDACLAFHDTDRSVTTASSVQVRTPVYSSSIGRWRRYQHLLQPLIEELDGGAPVAAATDEPPASVPRTLVPTTGA